MAVAGGGEATTTTSTTVLQKALQSVSQGTGWTYSILWRLCPGQGALVWAEGHYNGAIRTRKTTTMVELRHQPEDAGWEALRRSRQLRELYDSLQQLAGDGGDGGGEEQEQEQQKPRRRRPSTAAAAALAPEDLTETEWFYLMCASYCFPPAVGLPGEAFVRRVHVWLCGANKVDSKVFSRAILARTVACIPVGDGVLEIGNTENVEEDIGLIQYARSIFMDQHGAPIIMPTLSGHSTSTPTTHINHHPFQTKTGNCNGDINVLENSSLNPGREHNDEMEDDDDRIDLLQSNTENDSSRHSPQDINVGNEQGTLNVGSGSELMLIGTSERVRKGCSNQVDEEIPVLMAWQNANLAGLDELGPWHHFPNEDLSSKCLQSSEAEDQAVLAENAHYVETVLTILRFNACRQTQAASNIKTYLSLSKNSSFSRWNHKRSHDSLQSNPQRLLKSILLGAPSSSSSHRSYRSGETAAVQSPEPRDDGEGTSRSSRRGPVLKERRRREKKLNESFIMLRSLLPFVTKMDCRASILGDTIEYVRKLQRRIQELESRAPGLVDSNNPKTTTTTMAPAGTSAEASGSCCNTNSSCNDDDTEVQVSIIGSDDALLELRCPHREGLLLRVMQAMHQELRLEVTSVQASLDGDVLRAELRAKVKEVHGRRSSITEVKRAIHLIVSSD